MSDEAIVLDIEGTVCPISFVQNVLFPYALKRCQTEIPHIEFPLDPRRSEMESYLVQFPAEYTQDALTLIRYIEDIVRRDLKINYLKSLQGFLWKSGYESGEIKAPIYADAAKAIERWSKTKRVYIYSSGSVAAQELFFKYTEHGNLTPMIRGYFDTVNAGPKTEPSSFRAIHEAVKEDKYHFFSDNPREIDAAHSVGWNTVYVVRPGNPLYPDYKWPELKLENFHNI